MVLAGVYLFLLLFIGCQWPQPVQTDRINANKDDLYISEKKPFIHLSGKIEIDSTLMKEGKFFKVQVDCDLCFPTDHKVSNEFKVPIFKKKRKTSIGENIFRVFTRRRDNGDSDGNLGQLRVLISFQIQNGQEIEREWLINSIDNLLLLGLGDRRYIFKIGAFTGPLSLQFAIICSNPGEVMLTEDTRIVVRGKTDKQTDNELGQGILLAERKVSELPDLKENLVALTTSVEIEIYIDFTKQEHENLMQYFKNNNRRTKIVVEVLNSKIEHYNMASAASNYSNSCPICLSDFEDGDELLKIMPCKHLTHFECSKPWFAIPGKGCPICRSPKNDYEFPIENPVFSNDQYFFVYCLPVKRLVLPIIDGFNETINFWINEQSLLLAPILNLLNKDSDSLTSDELEQIRNCEFRINRLQTIFIANSFGVKATPMLETDERSQAMEAASGRTAADD